MNTIGQSYAKLAEAARALADRMRDVATDLRKKEGK